MEVLNFACINDDVSLARLIFTHYLSDIDIDKTIICAIDNDSIRVLEFILSFNANKNVIMDRSHTDVLKRIIINKKTEMFALLYKHDLVNISKSDYTTICKYDSIDILKILANGKNFSQDNDIIDIFNLAITAIEDKSWRVSKFLLTDAEKYVFDDSLMYSCIKYNYPDISWILKLYEKHDRAFETRNAIAYCIEHGKEETYKKVIESDIATSNIGEPRLIESLAYSNTSFFIDDMLKRDLFEFKQSTVGKLFYSGVVYDNYFLIKYLLRHKVIDKKILEIRSKQNKKLYDDVADKLKTWVVSLLIDFDICIHDEYLSSLVIYLSEHAELQILNHFINKKRLSPFDIDRCMYYSVINGHSTIIKYLFRLGYKPDFGMFRCEDPPSAIVISRSENTGYIYEDNLLTHAVINGFYDITNTLLSEGTIDPADLNHKALKMSMFLEDNDIFNLLLLDSRVRDSHREWAKSIYKTIYYSLINNIAAKNESRCRLLRNRLQALLSIKRKSPGSFGEMRETCGICLERDDYRLVYDYRCGSCNNRFHLMCVIGWFVKGDSEYFGGSCPLCRHQVDFVKDGSFTIGVRELCMG